MDKNKIEEIEIDLLIDAIFRRYGYDFHQYARASLKRRIWGGFEHSGMEYISQMISKILYDPEFFNLFFIHLSVNVTEMFRNPEFYLSLKKNIVPYLKTYPFVKIWVAGCATGEEVYSLAILLKEVEFYDKCLIYATDFNDEVLEKAKEGIYSIEHIKEYTSNYHSAGGTRSFGEYFHSDHANVIFDRKLKENIVFASHNLVTDDSFGEMNLVLCRNVLIYFTRELQNRVFRLFEKSLCHNGFLCLGRSETLKLSVVANQFHTIDEHEKIFQKKQVDE